MIIVADSAEALAVRAAEEIVHISGEAICMHGQFNLCLAGGMTPAETYRIMATRFEMSVDWKEVQFFFSDERCVPPDDPASNFAMANRTMLAKLGLKPAQIHRIRGEEEPAKAARDYEDEIREALSLNAGELPSFDLVLLGVGDNAHIASLFPGGAAIGERERLAVPVEVPAPQRHRVTLTPAVLNNAVRVMFIVAGEHKAQAVKNVIEGPRDPDLYPAQVITPERAQVMWILDKAAASLLNR